MGFGIQAHLDKKLSRQSLEVSMKRRLQHLAKSFTPMSKWRIAYGVYCRRICWMRFLLAFLLSCSLGWDRFARGGIPFSMILVFSNFIPKFHPMDLVFSHFGRMRKLISVRFSAYHWKHGIRSLSVFYPTGHFGWLDPPAGLFVSLDSMGLASKPWYAIP